MATGDFDRRSGKACYFTFGGLDIPIVKMTPKVTRKLGDTTDNGDYDEDQNMVATTQIPCTYTNEATIEGRFRVSTTPSSWLTRLFTGASNIDIVFGIDNDNIWGSGAFDISDFSTDIPVDDIVNYTATVRSNGIMTPNE